MIASQAAIADRFVRRLEREMASAEQVELGNLRFHGVLDEEPHPSKILQAHSKHEHRLGELYAEMVEKDGKLGALIDKRIDAVISLPMRVAPSGASPADLEAAALCAHLLDQPWIEDVMRHTLGARMRGIAISELTWSRATTDPFMGKWLPKIDTRPMHRFAFRRGQRDLFIRQGLTSDQWVKAPPGKFSVTRSGTNDSPWGGPSILDDLYYLWFISIHGWTMWAEAVERWAAPAATAEYDHGPDEKKNGEQQAMALQLAEALQGGNSIAKPTGIALDLMQATGAQAPTYSAFIGATDRIKSLKLLGEVNTSGDRPGVGAFASDQVGDGIRLEKVRLDAKTLKCWAGTIFSHITAINLGPDVAVPTLSIALEAAQDMTQRREGIDKALAEGLPVPQRQAEAAWGVDRPREGEPTITRSRSETD